MMRSKHTHTPSSESGWQGMTLIPQSSVATMPVGGWHITNFMTLMRIFQCSISYRATNLLRNQVNLF